MGRPAQNIINGPLFLHLPRVHHEHVRRHGPDDPKVVRDQYDRHSPALVETTKGSKYGHLRDNVQRGGRLISDQQIRIRRHRDGNANPLTHAATKLMRIAFQNPLRIGEADVAHCLQSARLHVLPV
jgi:hypothetical protein